MSENIHVQTAEEQVRTAYADVHDDKDNKERCLSFLTSEFVPITEVIQLTHLIGRYNRFNPEDTNDRLDQVIERDPQARVAIGREGSPVLYIETKDQRMVLDVFGNYPDEASEVEVPEDIGNARKYVEEDWDIDPHSKCRHESPPVAVEDYPECNTDLSYVRLWWD